MKRMAIVIGLALVTAGVLAIGCRAQGGSAFKNVQVLTHVKDKREMRAIMKEQAKALGVKCTYCHVQGKFDLDDKPEKVEAREMMRMVVDLNERYFADEEQGVTCWTCHRGASHPENLRPADAPDSGGGFQGP
ncbi:MAG: c-type cytochrome [Acidobacteriota bacterium]